MEKKISSSQQLADNRFSLDDISVTSIIRDVVKRIFLIILSAVVFATGFFIFKTETFKPIYTSETTFLVSTKDGSYDAYSNLTTTVQLNQVFKMILDSNALNEAVKEDLGLTDLDAVISAKVVEETNLLVLSVSASTPKDSYEILCSVIRNYPTFSDEVMGNAVLDVFDAPSVPTHADNSSGAVKWAIIGFMVGAVLMLALIVVLSFLKDTVKNERQVEKKLDTKLYVTVPHEKRRKRVGLLISDATSSFPFQEAYNKLRAKIEREAKHKGYKAFAVSSSLENEGKTTVTANLALSLAKKGYRILVADFDLRNPAVAKIFELSVPDDKQLSDYFMQDDRNVSIDNYILKNDKLGIDFLVSNNGVADVNKALRRSSLTSVVENLKSMYDMIIIDTPPIALVSDIDDVAAASDATLIVVREDEARTMVVNDSIDALTRTETPLLGAVFNDSASASNPASYGYAYYGGYNKYSGYGRYGKYGKYGKYAGAGKSSGSSRKEGTDGK